MLRICHTNATAFAVLLGIALSGCSVHKSMQKEAIEYNELVRQHSTNQIVLNILRAADQIEKEFTGIAQITPSRTTGIQAGFKIPVGPVADDWSITPTLNRSSSPSMQIAVLDAKKFVSGIQSPIEPKTLKYYADQGWPVRFLLTLALHLDDGPDYKQSTISPFDKCTSISIDKVRSCRFLGPKIKNETLSDVEKLKEFDSNGYLLLPERELSGLPKGACVCASDKHPNGLPCDRKQTRDAVMAATSLVPVAITSKSELNVTSCGGPSKEFTTSTFIFNEKSTGDGSISKGKLRSPEAIINFVGESLQHSQIDSNGYLNSNVKIWNRPLFRLVKRQTQSEDVAASVEYRGEFYEVDIDDKSSFSLMTIRLISQLIALHKESDELPSTQTVNIVGGPR